jgi:fructokinase
MILVAGENLVDLIETGGSAPPRFVAIPGGSPYNCARALARLGAPVGYLTPISADPLGDLLAEGLQREGAALLGGRNGRPASLALVTRADGQPRYRFYRDNTADRAVTAEGLRSAMPAAAEALHVGSMALMDGPDAEALAELFTHAAGRGLVTSIDPNIRADHLPAAGATAYRARLARLFALACIVKLSDEDLSWLAPGVETDAAAEALMADYGPTLLVVTRGAGGALVRHGGGRFDLPAAPVTRLEDTVGAGDSYMAALLAGLRAAGALTPAALESLTGEALRPILARAARAAAITCGRRGCDSPTRAELEAAAG